MFPLPEPLILKEAARVMSLRDGTKKMSKSDPSENSRINMTDGAEEIARKIKRAKTDPQPLPGQPSDLGERPEAANLMGIYASLADETLEKVCERFEGAPFSAFKEALTELAVGELAPVGDEMGRLMDDRAHLEKVLADGADRAQAIAQPILAEIHDIVGFLRPRQ